MKTNLSWKCLELSHAADGSSLWSVTEDGTQHFIRLRWSREDACWLSEIAGQRSCSGCGETPADALRDVLETKAAWLASRRPRRRFQPAFLRQRAE
jgi:hypothetical protein